ncbi:biliverdin-producing heme oxygenase [Sphingomonas sp.]|uniref:biliverdin-producing heme oxygenase n=1 Tax=Sphingomonas sp. TaxID=28214 RepID=UPI002DD6412A|nr:biliverdin-producing heme oxygenase [Sphingomonas sp.]
MKVRAALRDATGEHHARVDALFSVLRLEDAADYGAFLAAQAAAHLPVEAAIDAADVLPLLPDWPERRRAQALRDDLAALGQGVPTPLAPPQLSDPAALLGAIYVLEGARLGGAILLRSVPAGAPTRFLAPGRPGAWRKLMETLDERLDAPAAVAQAIAAAQSVFSLFERGGRNLIGTHALGRRG